LDSYDIGQGQMEGSLGQGSENSSCIKFGEFITWFRKCWLLKKDIGPWS
jgi:hypothetical protein